MKAATTSPAPIASPTAASRRRAVLGYALDGDLRFISHRDEVRMLARALVRAAWPVVYSGGFNPIPRLSIPLPRSVGMASTCQIALIDLAAQADGVALLAALRRTLPADCVVTRLLLDGAWRGLAPTAATYVLPLLDEERAAAAAACARFADAAQPFLIERENSKKQRVTIDLRPFVNELTISDAGLRAGLSFDGPRTARPADVLTICGLDAAASVHRLRRVAVAWNQDFSGHEFRPD